VIVATLSSHQHYNSEFFILNSELIPLYLIYHKYIPNYTTMKSISLKIDDDIFIDTEEILRQVNKPRNRYINEALDYYNTLQKRVMLAEKLKKESKLVSGNSMEILGEFESLEDED